ncbi:MAG: hypothetical protein V2A64_01110 [Candidatus Omnitrophota bacterium]
MASEQNTPSIKTKRLRAKMIDCEIKVWMGRKSAASALKKK